MIIKDLKPIRDKESYSRGLSRLLEYDLFVLIFKPLIDLLTGEDVKENSKASPLITAFASQRIYFQDGFVYGSFSAAISKALVVLGGKWSQQKKAFKISLAQLPPEVRGAIAKGTTAEKEAISKLKKKTQDLAPENIVIPGTKQYAEGTLKDLQEQFKKLTPQDLAIPLSMTEYQKLKMEEDYIENLNLSIEDLSKNTIERLRYRVEKAVAEGKRAEELKELLMAEYGITRNRAKFIARQETSLFVSKFRQTRYEEAGIEEYRWSTSGDERVRDSHKELNGRIFRWDSPPIVDKQTGRRAHPGMDYGCRCVALPVIKISGKDALSV